MLKLRKPLYENFCSVIKIIVNFFSNFGFMCRVTTEFANKFQESSSVITLKTSVRNRNARLNETIARVNEPVTVNPTISIRHRFQRSHIIKNSMQRFITKDLSQHGYKIHINS